MKFNDDIISVIDEYIEFAEGLSFSKLVKYIYDNTKFDYDLEDSQELYDLIIDRINMHKSTLSSNDILQKGAEIISSTFPLQYTKSSEKQTKHSSELNIKPLPEARQQTALKSNGVYSVLHKKWIKEPVAQDIPELDREAFDKLFNEWDKKYKNLINNNPTIESIEKFIEDIYDLRKNSIANDGEYGLGNLVFKECRNLGYIENLKDIKSELKTKELSLEGLQEDTEKVKDGKWVNKGKEGTHGTFRTKKEADAQRKAMFANGFKK